jgi:hypothetical protein
VKLKAMMEERMKKGYGRYLFIDGKCSCESQGADGEIMPGILTGISCRFDYWLISLSDESTPPCGGVKLLEAVDRYLFP